MPTAHSNLSSGPRSQTASVSMAPRQASTQLVPKTADPPSVLYLSHTASYRYSWAFQEIFTTLDTISPPPASSNRRQSRTQLLYPTVYRGLQLPETPSHLQVHCKGLSVPSNRTTRIESPSSLFANQNRWTIASTGKLWTSSEGSCKLKWRRGIGPEFQSTMLRLRVWLLSYVRHHPFQYHPLIPSAPRLTPSDVQDSCVGIEKRTKGGDGRSMSGIEERT
jgi:hypothetical protein